MIYADNAATTRMTKTTIAAMLPYFDTTYVNPSSLHAAVTTCFTILQNIH